MMVIECLSQGAIARGLSYQLRGVGSPVLLSGPSAGKTTFIRRAASDLRSIKIPDCTALPLDNTGQKMSKTPCSSVG